MPRRKTPFLIGGMYHVFNRSIEGKEIFVEFEDCEFFIKRMLHFAEEFKIEIHAWAILPNHYHIFIHQTDEHSVSKFMHRLGLTYAMYFNRKYKRRGPLFESRFKAVEVCSKESYVRLKDYIEFNAVNHKIVEDVSEWPLTSLMTHLPGTDIPEDFADEKFGSFDSWKDTS